MANTKANIDWAVMDAMLQFNPSCRMVADHFKCSVRTVENYVRSEHDMTFKEYKDTKLDRVRLKLQQTAIQMAFGKDRTMLIFCLKNLCAWADKVETEVTNKEIKIDVFSNENPLRKNGKTRTAG